jgi:hypothetical protein
MIVTNSWREDNNEVQVRIVVLLPPKTVHFKQAFLKPLLTTHWLRTQEFHTIFMRIDKRLLISDMYTAALSKLMI